MTFVLVLCLVLLQLVVKSDGLNLGRELQSSRCPFASNNPQGAIENIVAKVTLNSIRSTTVNVQVIYDIKLTSGTLGAFDFRIFNSDFGDVIGRTISESFDFPENENTTAQQKQVFSNANGDQSASYCFSEPITFVSVVFDFQVDNGVCTHPDGRQALPASWISDITGENTVNFAEVDYSIPIDNSVGFNVDNYDITNQFIPTATSVSLGNSVDDLEVFIRYNPSDLFIQDEEVTANVFLFLPENVFDSQELRECPEFKENNLFTIILIAVPSLACCCIIGLVIGQRYFDHVENQRFRRFRENHPDGLRLFPGNRDIILVPGAGGEDGGIAQTTTVTAVHENDDLPELDDAIPTTTINIRLSEDVEDI